MDARVKPALDELSRGTMFRPFPIITEAPYLGDDENSRRSERAAKVEAKARARSGQAFEEGPGEPTRAKAARPELPPIEPGARGAAQSRHRQGHRRDRARRPDSSRRRTIRSTAAPISPPHTARAIDPQGFDEAPQADYAGRCCRRRDRPELAKALGYDGRSSKTLIAHRPKRRERDFRQLEPRREKRTAFRGDHRRDRHRAGAGKAAARGPARIQRRRPWTPHRPPRPEKSEGGMRFVIKSDFEPKGDQPHGDRRTGRGRQAPRAQPGAARRHRLGQDLHHGQGDRGDAAPGADPRAEQDPGGAALRRVQELLPRQRGRVFRLLLRLLPARGLRPAHRHLHREGILDQRADRPHAPLGDARAARARRRHHRRLGVLHLRHRLGRDLYGDDLHAQAAASASTSASSSPTSSRCNTSAAPAISTRGTFRVRGDTIEIFPAHYEDRAWRMSLFGDEVEIDRRVRSAHRQEDRRARIREDLRQLALRHAAPDAACRRSPASRPS